MEGNIHSGRLSPTLFARATAADDGEIRALLRDVPMQGALRIGFGREPSFFADRAPMDGLEHTLAARRDGRLVSVGSWSEREVWLQGERKTVGYLHGLRMAPGTAESMRVLREGYAALARETAGSQAVGWFTSVDASNTRARRVLESRANGLPGYRRIADYLTRVFPVSKRGGPPPETLASTDEIVGFLNREGARHDLAMTWSDTRFQPGFPMRDIAIVRRRGRIVAAAGVWDQSSWKQVVIHQYPRWMTLLRPAAAVGTGLGWPKLPAPGNPVPLASVFPFAVARHEALPELWRDLAGIARRRGIEWLALGLDASDPLWQHLRRIGISYRTILYWVCGRGFPEPTTLPPGHIVRPECAML